METKPIDQIEFRGAIGNQLFPTILMNQFINALQLNGWREAHNAHIYQRLVQRGAMMGLRTPNDLARALRDGYTPPGDRGASVRVCGGGQCWVVFRENEFITIRPPRRHE